MRPVTIAILPPSPHPAWHVPPARHAPERTGLVPCRGGGEGSSRSPAAAPSSPRTRAMPTPSPHPPPEHGSVAGGNPGCLLPAPAGPGLGQAVALPQPPSFCPQERNAAWRPCPRCFAASFLSSRGRSERGTERIHAAAVPRAEPFQGGFGAGSGEEGGAGSSSGHDSVQKHPTTTCERCCQAARAAPVSQTGA